MLNTHKKKKELLTLPVPLRLVKGVLSNTKEKQQRERDIQHTTNTHTHTHRQHSVCRCTRTLRVPACSFYQFKLSNDRYIQEEAKPGQKTGEIYIYKQ